MPPPPQAIQGAEQPTIFSKREFITAPSSGGNDRSRADTMRGAGRGTALN